MPAQPMTAPVLFDLMQGPTRWQIVRLAFAERIFDQLVEPKTADAIAEHFSFDPRRTALYLKSLCSMGLMTTDGTTFTLRDDNAHLLRSDSDKCLRSTLMAVSYMRGVDVEALLRNEEPDRNMNMHAEEFWDKSGDSLRSFHRGMAEDEMYGILSSLPEWPDVRKIVDLGAGSEVLAKRITTEDANKSVTLVDLPPMIKRMQDALEGHPAADRISTIAGDYNTVEFPQDADLMWASMTLYFVKDMEAFFKRAHAALKPGGLFVSLHEGLTEHRTLPEAQIVGRLTVSMEMEETGMDAETIPSAMRQAGFKTITIKPMETVVGEMVLTIGRTV